MAGESVVTLQLVTIEPTSVLDVVVDAIAEFVSEIESSDVEASDLAGICQVNYSLLINGSQERLTSLDLVLEDYDFESSNRIVAQLIDFLGSGEDLGIRMVVKLFDGIQLEMRKSLVEEIFHIEMRLREAFNAILILNFDCPDQSRLLENSSIKTVPSMSAPEVRLQAETDLFYILFSDYRNITQRPSPNLQKVTEVAMASTSFEEFQRGLSSKLQIADVHEDFIASISDSLDAIEKLRNACMHNRHISSRLLQNYHKAREQLNGQIDRFLGESLRINGDLADAGPIGSLAL